MLSLLAQRLYRTQASYLRQLAADFANADPAGTADFVLALRYTVAHTDFLPVQISDRVQVSEGTLTRWMSGEVSPHEIMRSTAFKQLQGLLNEKADRFESMASADLSTVQGRLKYARQVRDEDETDCAGAVGVLTSTWEIWEQKGIAVAPEHLRPTIFTACAKVLGCATEWLKDGVGDPPRFDPAVNRIRMETQRLRWDALLETVPGVESRPTN